MFRARFLHAFSYPARLCMLSLGLWSGCELDRPNFQMNSNSPTPFFGIDLLPRRKTTSLTRPTSSDRVADATRAESQASGATAAPVSWPIAAPTEKNKALIRSIELPLKGQESATMVDRGPIELFP